MRNARATLHFVLAAAVLGGSAAGMHYAKSSGALQLIKKPLPIRKPLKDLDRAALAPLRVAVTRTLSTDVVDELGTEEYIDWALENPAATVPAGASASLAVTYYTGKQDQVPHVPEECLTQGAYSKEGDEEITLCGGAVPVRRLTFAPPPGLLARDADSKTVVYYTFSVNGDYYAGRTAARLRMGALDEGWLYYSKVELGFRAGARTNMDQLDRAASGVFEKVLPELEQSHWPAKGTGKIGPRPD